MHDQQTIERIAAAIDGVRICHSMTLVRLVDGVNTYRVAIDDEVEEFTDTEEADALEQAYARIRTVIQQRQAEAIMAVIASLPPQGMEQVAWRCSRDQSYDGNGNWHYRDGPPNHSHLARNVQELFVRRSPASPAEPFRWVTVRVEDTCDGLLIHADDMKQFNLRGDVHYEGHFLPDGRYQIAVPDPAPKNDSVVTAEQERAILDIIRSAYDRGYNDARNATATPGDNAPGYRGREVERAHTDELVARFRRLLSQTASTPRQTKTEAIKPYEIVDSSFGQFVAPDLPQGRDMIVVAINQNGLKPVWLGLPHQLYLSDIEKLLTEHGGDHLTVIPYRNADKFNIPNTVLATTGGT